MKEQRMINLVIENLELVKILAKKYQRRNYYSYEELLSIGTIGLIKAIDTYDTKKKVKFITYASKCIQNEIFMYFRMEKKHQNNVPLETLSQTQEPSYPFFFETNLKINQVLTYLPMLKEQELYVILLFLSGKTQVEIANLLNMSQSYVSRLKRNGTKNIKEAIQKEFIFLDGKFTIQTDGKYLILTITEKKSHVYLKEELSYYDIYKKIRHLYHQK